MTKDELANQEEYVEHVIAPNGTIPEDQVSPTEFPQLIQKCYVVKAKGKKSGNEYIALRVEFTNGYSKMIFFEQAEQFMVEAEIDKLTR